MIKITIITMINNFKKIIKTSKNIRRIFGKKELEIMEKQISGRFLTQSERNRLSRDIKPKLACIQELAPFQSEFSMKKNQETKATVEKAVQAILDDKEKEKVQAIVLFGSYADNTSTSRSDIDIGIISGGEVTAREATDWRMRIAGQLPDKVDIQVFNVLPQKIKRDIARNHRVLFKRKGHDDLAFSIKYMKDEDYFLRMKKVFVGAE